MAEAGRAEQKRPELMRPLGPHFARGVEPFRQAGKYVLGLMGYCPARTTGRRASMSGTAPPTGCNGWYQQRAPDSHDQVTKYACLNWRRLRA